MKITAKSQKFVILVLIALVSLFLNACKAGMSQQDRLDAFKADIVAGADVRGHFRGPNADTIDENTFLSTSLSPSNGISFYSGDVINNDGFITSYSYTPGDDQATGFFVNETSSGVSGDDWYISSITINALENYDTLQTIP